MAPASPAAGAQGGAGGRGGAGSGGGSMSGQHAEIDRALDDRARRSRARVTTPGPEQRRAIETLVAGRSLLVVAPESWGAAMCWQVAAAARGGQVLVIASTARPLAHRAEALAHDAGLVACALDGDRPPAVTEALAAQIAAGHYDVVLVSARQLGDPHVHAAALACRPWLVAVEDADRVSTHALRHDPSLARVAGLLAELRDPTVLALAAAAPAPVCDDIIGRLHLRDPERIVAALDLPDLRIEVHNTPGRASCDSRLTSLLATPPERVLVFTSLRVEAERLAAMIQETWGLPTAAVHGGVTGEQFANVMRRFREGSLRVLVATGGLDRDERWPPVPLVVQYSLPPTLEQYLRQAQCAGGDGRPARCVLMYDREDAPRLGRAGWRCAPEPGHLLSVHRAAQAADGRRLSYDALSRATGLHADEVHLAVEALTAPGALRVRRRGDDWLETDAAPLDPGVLAEYAARTDAMRRARVAQADQLVAFALTRRCRRAFLAEALGLDRSAQPGECCDRCTPRAHGRAVRPPALAYPIRAAEFRGWALCIYRRPGDDAPTETAASLLHALKYEGDTPAARRLAYLMARLVRDRAYLQPCRVIVPVPPTDPADDSSPAVLLATAISRLVGRPMVRALVSASAERVPQKELASGEEKGRNIAGAFEVVDAAAIRDRRVLLVDDIFDSGATMAEAANTLRGAGAADVRLLAAVRTTFGWRSDV